ncbi:MAG: DUF1080 domain-containing protein [Gammaproteobacteria bacterium]|nr:DUF1080 domain-containing protein [Gammaproteobacteria bacterium]MDH5691476.1 DUF1080 domain-containing protein [Gammaproteobacteria bacterium]
MRRFLIPILLTIAFSAQADSVSLPHTFKQGDKASAQEVNEQFDEVKRAVDDNDTRLRSLEGSFFNDDFESTTLRPVWTLDEGTWNQAGGTLTSPVSDVGHNHVSGMKPMSDLQIEVDFNYDNGADAGVYFGLSDAGGYLWVFRNNAGQTDSFVQQTTGYGAAGNTHLVPGSAICKQNHTSFGSPKPSGDKPLHIRLLIVGNRFDAWVDGVHVTKNCFLPAEAPPGRIGLYAWSGVGNQSFDNIQVAPVVRQNLADALSGAISFTSDPYTGTQFAANSVAGTAMCPTGTHICNAWEYSIISILAQDKVQQGHGWLIGGFPNLDGHLRSLTSGQHSTECGTPRPNNGDTSPSPLYLSSWAKHAAKPSGNYYGRVHCQDATQSLPVACCRANLLGGLN